MLSKPNAPCCAVSALELAHSYNDTQKKHVEIKVICFSVSLDKRFALCFQKLWHINDDADDEDNETWHNAMNHKIISNYFNQIRLRFTILHSFSMMHQFNGFFRMKNNFAPGFCASIWCECCLFIFGCACMQFISSSMVRGKVYGSILIHFVVIFISVQSKYIT